MSTELEVTVGFAADEAGRGVAYAATGTRGVLRLPFTVRRLPALRGREVAYAAATAVAEALRRRGCERALFRIDDPWLSCDLRDRPALPRALTMPYVRLGCALNRFAAYRVEPGNAAARDLTARARGDVALNVAA